MSRAIGPLASFDESALRELAPRGAARSFPKNAVIFSPRWLAPGRRDGVSRTGLSLAGDNRVHSAGKINKKQPARHAFLGDTATS